MIVVGRLEKIAGFRFFCIAICLSLHFTCSQAQQLDLTQLPADGNRTVVIVPVFTERESDVGSAFLSDRWIRGSLELANHKRIPEGDQILFFNFDKVNQLVYVIDQSRQERSYPIDSVSGFELMINNQIFSFEKISWISNNYFLTPVYKSEKGYSLYKRLFTKWERSAYQNVGYYSTGKKYDEYIDYYEYYLIYPGNTRFRKLSLKEKAVRKAFPDETSLLTEFFNLHDNEIDEQNLIGLLQYVNDKKYPD
jgi:hypothetical protein